jgi:hypothetical protein
MLRNVVNTLRILWVANSQSCGDRRATANPEAIIGTTETASITGEQPFAVLEELCNILLRGPATS